MTDVTPAGAIIPVEQLDKVYLVAISPDSHVEYGMLKVGGDGVFFAISSVTAHDSDFTMSLVWPMLEAF